MSESSFYPVYSPIPLTYTYDSAEWSTGHYKRFNGYSWIFLGYSTIESINVNNVFRFNNVTIPQGSTINSATLYIKSSSADSGAVSLKIYGNDTDNPSFPTSIATADALVKTTANVDWDITDAWDDTVTYSSPDLSTIIQEIVDRVGFSSGNNLQLILNFVSGSIYRTADRGGVTGIGIKLTVDYTAPPVTLSSITVTPSTASLKGVGSTRQLIVIGTYSDDSTDNLTAASEGTTYESDDPTLATVSSGGLVTAVAAGTATITATNTEKTNTCVATIVLPTSLECFPSEITLRGEDDTQQLQITANYADGSKVYITSSTKGTTYISSDTSIATISDDGLITSVGVGETTIVASNGSLTTSCVVTVIAGTRTYARDSDLVIVYDNIHYYADDSDTWQYLVKAYDWVRDSIRTKISPPDPTTDTISETLVLAEAHYAVYLILKAHGESPGASVRSLDFYNEAWRLIGHILDSVELEDTSTRGGPTSNSQDMEPTFSKGRYDRNDIYVGNKMGIGDAKKGSLDDW